MGHSRGYHHGTRRIYQAEKKNDINIRRRMEVFRKDDKVIVKGNGVYQKGLPFKYYQGRIGVVFSVGPRAIGITVQKRVKGTNTDKLLYIHPEHLVKVKDNKELKKSKLEMETKLKALIEKANPADKKDLVKMRELVGEARKLTSVYKQPEPAKAINIADYEVIEVKPKDMKNKYLRKCDVAKIGK
eukprot:GAHX01000214.1.p1 GENE.GAHX01000214.1~~GAHX01000214.1.p1  ORF type:complete len:186 (+),score=36.95 GAHX01000214.1:49-606(+)